MPNQTYWIKKDIYISPLNIIYMYISNGKSINGTRTWYYFDLLDGFMCVSPYKIPIITIIYHIVRIRYERVPTGGAKPVIFEYVQTTILL